jgi:hypothetical protein
MSAPRAADLPVGSVVEHGQHDGYAVRYYRTARNPNFQWESEFGGTLYHDSDVQRSLDDGAEVLRVGDGSDR